MLISIIVPVYNALEYARACIDSIYQCRTMVAFEVIVVDNGSSDAVGLWAKDQQNTRTDFTYLRFDQPLGFSRAINAGASIARGEHLVLLNSDTLVTDGWLDRLVAALADDASLGVVGPVTNRCGHDLQRDSNALTLFPEEAADYASRISSRDEIVIEPQRLVFFCAMVRRSVWDLLGGLDEVFGTGNFEDDDFCLRTRLAGYQLAVVRGVFVFHNEGKTFLDNEINHAETLARNRSIFDRRASAASRIPRLGPATRQCSKPSISVLIIVSKNRLHGLHGTLASLTNQTLSDFETIVVSTPEVDLSSVLAEFRSVLRIKSVIVGDSAEASLWNGALSAAAGEWTAYLPAGDIFYPFHLEVLLSAALRAGRPAVHSAWSVVVAGEHGERREAVEFFESIPDIELGDWAPLPCWLHAHSVAAGLHFNSAFGAFCAWAFTIELYRLAHPLYVCRLTCELHPSPPTTRNPQDVEAVLAAFPVSGEARNLQRGYFLNAVRKGLWQDNLILARNEKVRRARRMLQQRSATIGETSAYADLRSRLQMFREAASEQRPNPARADIFLFSIIEWTTLTQRPHHFAEGLAARGHRVFWIDARLRPPRDVDAHNLSASLKPGIYHVMLPGAVEYIYPLSWNEERLQGMVDCIEHLRIAYNITDAIQLVNFPRWEPLTTRLKQQYSWPIAYDCLDNQPAFADLFGHALGNSESELIAKSSTITASGSVLHERLKASDPDAVLIPNGVDYKTFSEAVPAGLLDHLDHPIAGFFGAFADWLDLDWIEAAAQRFPAWSFVYIGSESFSMTPVRLRWRALAAIPNIHVFGQVDPHTLSQYLAQFDVCLMPFRDLAMTRSMNAVKIYEYLAAGKPVVARDLPETRLLAAEGLIVTYDSHEASFTLLERLIELGSTETKIAARKEFASKNTWSDRVDALCRALTL